MFEKKLKYSGEINPLVVPLGVTVLEVEEVTVSCKACLLSYCFLLTKNSFQKLVTFLVYFHPFFIECFCFLLSYSSEMRSRYTLNLLLMCLEMLRKRFSCFSVRD